MNSNELDFDKLDFEKGNGTVTVVAQDATTGAVLMVAAADRKAVEATIATGEMHYTSRTRGFWHKGETSGNVQKVVALEADCDGDVVLARVQAAGPACHTGEASCFGGVNGDVLTELDSVITARHGSDDSTYTGRLLGDENLRTKKIGEEAAELVSALVKEDRARLAEEVADLLYHALAAASAVGVTLDDVRAVLAQRRANG